jgi:hypothetical protein
MVPGQSELHAGDWLVVPPWWVPKPYYVQDPRMGPPAGTAWVDRRLRLRTMPSYYGGMFPLERWPSPHLEVVIYRVQADWTPQPPW